MAKPYTPIFFSKEIISHNISQNNDIIAYNLIEIINNYKNFGYLIKDKNPFVFYFQLNAETLDLLTSDILFSYLFSPSYLKKDSNPVFLYSATDWSLTKENFNKFEIACRHQGFTNIYFYKVEIFSNEDLPAINSIFKISDLIAIKIKKLNFLYLCVKEPDFILFEGQTLDEVKDLEDNFWLKIQYNFNNSLTFNKICDQLISIKENNKSLSNHNKLLLERLENATKFIDLAKDKFKDDFNLLQQFYQQEYEVLPLWYKRFGHLIKVITGKRKWKSLFKD